MSDGIVDLPSKAQIQIGGTFRLDLVLEYSDEYAACRIAEHFVPLEGEIVGGPQDGQRIRMSR